MPKLPIISGIEAIKAFSKAGWIPHRQVGSHVVLRKEGSKVTLSIPKHKELKPGLKRNKKNRKPSEKCKTIEHGR